MKLQCRKELYNSLNLHQLYSAMKQGIPNISLQVFDEYGWQRIKLFRQSHISFQVQGWLTGHFSLEFRFSHSIPNIVWYYAKLVTYLQKAKLF